MKKIIAITSVLVLSINLIFAQCSIDSVVSTDLCGGICDGTIEVFASSGSGTYMYSIDDGTTLQACNLFTGLCSATYSVVIDDMSGCQDTNSVILTEPAALFAFTGAIDASCNGSCDGSMNVIAFGGSGSYTYFWNTTPVQTNATATGLCAGNHDGAVQDANGCWAQYFGTISAPTPIIDSTSSTNTTSCGAGGGTATVYANGGVPPYTYLWNTAPVQNTQTATFLSASMYTVIVIDANGCIEFAGVGVSEIGGEILTASTTNVSCNGSCDGTATVSFTCGSAPCSIIWYDGSGSFIGQTSITATGLCAGEYFVQVTNNSGCVSFDQVTINEPLQINATKNWTNTSCIGICDGSATVFATGGTPPYTYLWNTTPFQTNPTATGLCAGITYTGFVTDQNSCDDNVVVTIGSPDTIVFNTSKIDASCGVCDGQAITCVTGGTPPYSYSWTSGSTTFYEDSMCAGVFGVIVTDANSCVASESVTISGVSTASIDSIVTADVTPCFGDTNGTITIFASSGSPPYEYSIDSGITYQSDSNFTGLGAGTYNIAVQGVDSCPQFGSPLTINEPSPIFIPVSDTICDNDSTLLEGAYQDTPGIYYDTLPSVDGCDSVVATTLTVNPSYDTMATAVICQGDSIQLPGGAYADTSGIYFDTLSSANSCDSIIATTLIVNPTYSTNTANETICDGDSVSIFSVYRKIAGTYYDSLTTANSCDSVIATTLIVNSTYSNNTPDETICDGDSLMIFGVYRKIAGIYYDSLTTVNSCDSIIVTALLVNPTYDTTVTSVICEGDSIQLPAGTYADTSGTYYDTLISINGCDSSITITLTVNPTYSINTPDQTICDGDSVMIFSVYRKIAGTYYDSLITVNSCDSVSITTLIVDPTMGLTTGSLPDTSNTWVGLVWVVISGGTPPYTYQWSGPIDINADTVEGVISADYIITVTDSNGCISSANVTVGNFTGLETFKLGNSIKIFPNPNTGQFTLEMNLQEETRLNIKLYHFTGQLIHSEVIIRQLANGHYTQQMDLSKYSKGIYYVQIVTDAGVIVKKVIYQ